MIFFIILINILLAGGNQMGSKNISKHQVCLWAAHLIALDPRASTV